MMKFNAGYVKERQAYLIGLGFSEENITRLLVNNEPINFTSDEFCVPGEGFAMFIFGAKDESELKVRLKGHLSRANRTRRKLRVKLNVLRFAEGLIYLMVMAHGKAKPVYLVGLVEKSFAAMRENRMPQFRARMLHKEGTNIEVLMFCGESRESMEDMFVSKGMISRDKVKRI